MFRFVLSFVLCTTSLSAADWSQFRGPHSASAGPMTSSIPIEWNHEQNVAWRVELPGRGASGAIVVGDRVFVTSSSGYDQDRLHVLCFATDSGELLWERQFWSTGRTKCHPSSANAAPTPASDGQAIYAFYSSNDLICLELNGDLRWYRGLAYDFPKAGNDVGMASSPVVAQGTVVVQVENQGDSFVAGIDTGIGETRWQIDRPKVANWSSPVITATPSGDSVVLVKSAEGLDAHDLQTGLLRWSFSGPAGGIPSIATAPGRIFLPMDGITALRLSSDSSEPQLQWSSPRLNSGSNSPVVSGDYIYVINRGGVLACANLSDGEVQWQLRLKGTFWATPVAVGNRMYCINDAGLVHVVDLTDKGKLIATNELGEAVQGSPAVTSNAMYVRTGKALWKIAATQ